MPNLHRIFFFIAPECKHFSVKDLLCLLCALMLASCAYAQTVPLQPGQGLQPQAGQPNAGVSTAPADTSKPTPQKPAVDTLRYSALSVGFDLSRLLLTYLTPADRRFEVTADWNLNKHFICAELGQATDTYHGLGYNYFSNGSYLRLGYEKNVLINTEDIYFVGARYGISNYRFKADDVHLRGDSVGLAFYGNPSFSVPEKAVQAQWVEFVTGLKVKLLPSVYMGFTARLKLKLSETDNGAFQSMYIPGYGTEGNSANVGFNYYLQVRIPYRKKIVKLVDEDE